MAAGQLSPGILPLPDRHRCQPSATAPTHAKHLPRQYRHAAAAACCVLPQNDPDTDKIIYDDIATLRSVGVASDAIYVSSNCA